MDPMFDYSAFLIFTDSPRRSPEQNERARLRAIKRLREMAYLAGEFPTSAAEFANLAEDECDSRGDVLVIPHVAVPELA